MILLADAGLYKKKLSTSGDVRVMVVILNVSFNVFQAFSVCILHYNMPTYHTPFLIPLQSL